MTEEASVDITASSTEEAIILGLTRLAATRDEVRIEILDEGSRGFLGLGTRPARVRLTRRSPQAQSLVSELATTADAPLEEEGAAAPSVLSSEELQPGEPHFAQVAVESRIEEPEEADLEAKVGADTKLAPEAREVVAHQPLQRTEHLDRAAVSRAAEAMVPRLLPGLRLEIETSWEEEEQPALWIAVRGRDANALVGPQAQTLDAVQYLFRTLLHRQVAGAYNVVVDADNFRLRRRRTLETMAREKADRAVELGRTIKLKPMPADERRVIHITLRDDPRVETESVGRGHDRAITIIPKK